MPLPTFVGNVHQTRQRTDAFTTATALLVAGASVTSNILRAQGMTGVAVLARANAAATGRIRIFQSIDGTNFVLTDEEASAVDVVSGESVAFLVAAITGRFVRIQFTNTSGGTQTAFDILAYLVPISGGAGGGGGGGGFAADTRNADADADFAEALIGLVTNSRLGAVDNIGTSDYRRLEASLLNAIPGTTVASIVGLEAASHLFGSDSTGAAVARALEARNADANADAAAALIGLLTTSRICALGTAVGDWARLSSSQLNTVSGLALTIEALHTVANIAGVDNTGAAVLRPVEARPGALLALGSLTRLLTRSFTEVYSETTADVRAVGGLTVEVGNGIPAMGVLKPHLDEYWRSLRGRAFRLGVPAGTATVTGVAAFLATTPSILVVPAATNEHLIRRLRIQGLSLTGTARVCVVTDPDDRFSAGGTTRVSMNRNLGSVATDTPTRALDGAITATATDGDERDMGSKFFTAVGGVVEWTEDDGLIIAPAGSLLVYVNDQAGAVAPVFIWEEDYELANVQ